MDKIFVTIALEAVIGECAYSREHIRYVGIDKKKAFNKEYFEEGIFGVVVQVWSEGKLVETYSRDSVDENWSLCYKS